MGAGRGDEGAGKVSEEEALALFSGLIRIFSESLELAPLVRRTLAHLNQGFRSDAAGMFAFEDEKLVLLGHHGRPEMAPPTKKLSPSQDWLAGRCVLSRQTEVASLIHW